MLAGQSMDARELFELRLLEEASSSVGESSSSMVSLQCSFGPNERWTGMLWSMGAPVWFSRFGWRVVSIILSYSLSLILWKLCYSQYYMLFECVIKRSGRPIKNKSFIKVLNS